MLSLWWLFLLRAAAPKTHLVSHYSIKRNIDNKYSHNHKLQSAPDPKTNPKISWSLGIRNSTSGSASNGRSNGRKSGYFEKSGVLLGFMGFWLIFPEMDHFRKKLIFGEMDQFWKQWIFWERVDILKNGYFMVFEIVL